MARQRSWHMNNQFDHAKINFWPFNIRKFMYEFLARYTRLYQVFNKKQLLIGTSKCFHCLRWKWKKYFFIITFEYGYFQGGDYTSWNTLGFFFFSSSRHKSVPLFNLEQYLPIWEVCWFCTNNTPMHTRRPVVRYLGL